MKQMHEAHLLSSVGQMEGVPFLTIILCAYKHEDYIDQCLEGIDGIKFESLELVIIDDGSPDDTLRKCLNFKFKRELAVRIYSKPNQGLVHSLNCGLDFARGQYITFMGSDDYYLDKGIDSAIEVISASDKTIDALLCQARNVGKVEGFVYNEDMQSLFNASPMRRLETVWSSPPRPMLIQATIFRADFLRGLNPWSDGLELDDWPTFIRVFAAETYFSAVVRYQSDLMLCAYRLHAGGIHTRIDRHQRVVEQAVHALVPEQYQKICLADIKIETGAALLSRRQYGKGLKILLAGIWLNPSLKNVRNVLFRAKRIVAKKLFGSDGRHPVGGDDGA